MSCHIIYYEDKNGNCPIFEFIESRKKRDKAKIFSWLSLLEEKGPQLHRPYSDILVEGIHELRIKLSGDQVRVLYYFCFKDLVVLTHAFIKKGDKVPKKEIRKAINFRNDFSDRFKEGELRSKLNEDI